MKGDCDRPQNRSSEAFWAFNFQPFINHKIHAIPVSERDTGKVDCKSYGDELGRAGHEKSSRVMVTDFASIASMTFINVAISGIWPLRSRATVVGLIFNILAVARTDPIKSSFFVIVLSFIKLFLSLLLLAISQAVNVCGITHAPSMR
jgi:hypothetical protein